MVDATLLPHQRRSTTFGEPWHAAKHSKSRLAGVKSTARAWVMLTVTRLKKLHSIDQPTRAPRSESNGESTARTNRLLYIWIWLPTAILGAVLATPANIFEIVLAMAFALPCFIAGVAWASELDTSPRLILTIAWVVVAGSLAIVTRFSLVPIFLAIATVFAVVNMILGVKSCGAIFHNRCWIFGALGVSYAVGLLLGPPGAVILTVPSLLIANRNTAVNK